MSPSEQKTQWVIEFTNSLNWPVIQGGRLDRGVVLEWDPLGGNLLRPHT